MLDVLPEDVRNNQSCTGNGGESEKMVLLGAVISSPGRFAHPPSLAPRDVSILTRERTRLSQRQFGCSARWDAHPTVGVHDAKEVRLLSLPAST